MCITKHVRTIVAFDGIIDNLHSMLVLLLKNNFVSGCPYAIYNVDEHCKILFIHIQDVPSTTIYETDMVNIVEINIQL